MPTSPTPSEPSPVRCASATNWKSAPPSPSTYYVAGLPNAPTYRSFEEAYQFSLEQLKTIVREGAKAAGTSQTRVEITVRDRIAPAADGTLLFIGRVLEAHLTGRPDLTRFVSSPSSL